MYHSASATGFVSNPILHRNHTYYGFQNYIDTTWLQVSISPAPVFYLPLTILLLFFSDFQTILFKVGVGGRVGEHADEKTTSPFHHVDSRDQTQVIRHENKQLYLPCHLADPIFF